MIIKPRRRGGFKAFSDYLAGKADNRDENEAVNLIADSLGVGDINEFCLIANRIAQPFRSGKNPLKNPIEHIILRTRKGDLLTPDRVQSKLPELLRALKDDNPSRSPRHRRRRRQKFRQGLLRLKGRRR